MFKRKTICEVAVFRERSRTISSLLFEMKFRYSKSDAVDVISASTMIHTFNW